jgi:Xaa-Pro aminopeptidase
LLRAAADLLDDAYLEVFPAIRDGEPESSVHARIVESCIRRGAGWAHGILHSHRNTLVYGGESAAPFRTGDVIRTDYVTYLRGYPGHQSRTVILGTPTTEQRATYAKVRDVYLRVIDLCRPGALASDIYALTSEWLGAIGARTIPMLCGHGVGSWWHQQEPLIAAGAAHRLEAGMVLALETYLDHWHIQDMVLVTESAPVLLSARFPTDVPFAVEPLS